MEIDICIRIILRELYHILNYRLNNDELERVKHDIETILIKAKEPKTSRSQSD